MGLRAVRRNQPVFGAEGAAGLIKGMASGRLALALRGKAVGEGLTVVGQNLLDRERAGGGEPFEDTLGALGGLVGQDLALDPAAGAVDGDAKIGALRLVGHPRQRLEVVGESCQRLLAEQVAPQPGDIIYRVATLHHDQRLAVLPGFSLSARPAPPNNP